MEKELKFQMLDSRNAGRYARAEYWQALGLKVLGSETAVMSARYYDDNDLSLARKKASLRLRLENRQWVMTLKRDPAVTSGKAEEDGLFLRDEWEWELSSGLDPHEAEREARQLLSDNVASLPEFFRDFAVSGSWNLLYESRFSRWRADLVRQETLLEAAVDEGSLLGLYGDEPIAEVELELKQGRDSELANVQKLLLQDTGLVPGRLSKAARLRRLSTADLIIVGAGAAGLMAAIGFCGKSPEGTVVLLEGKNTSGQKISATGNGRGNITHLGLDASNYHETAADADGVLIQNQLALMPPDKLRRFFHDIGLYTTTEGDLVYPYSYQARSIREILTEEALRSAHSHLVTDSPVSEIIPDPEANLFYVRSSAGTFMGTRLIIAAGGEAYPQLGSDGSGFRLLRDLGFPVTKTYPGLVQLVCRGIPKRLAGQRVRSVLSLGQGGQILGSEAGEVLFTDYGLSGIAVLNLSHLVSARLNESGHGRQGLWAELDLVPDMTEGPLTEWLRKRQSRSPEATAASFASGLLSEKLSGAVAALAGIPSGVRLADLADSDLKMLAGLCKGLRFDVTDTKGYKHAQVCCGGVPCREFNPHTLESLSIPGLYAAGEILDVFGDCGGYNLHFAFASGLNAGRQAAASLPDENPKLIIDSGSDT